MILERRNGTFKEQIVTDENHDTSSVSGAKPKQLPKHKMSSKAHPKENRGIYRVLVGKPEGKGQLGERGIDGRIIL